MAWEVRYSNSKHLPYFYNPDTSESRWEAPTGMTDDQVRNLPGAAQYLGGAGGARAPKASASNGAGDEKVRASHILAKHAGSRRPSSWRQVRVILPYRRPTRSELDLAQEGDMVARGRSAGPQSKAWPQARLTHPTSGP
jgi:hypothetical protein